ncbi:hypothetical protein CYLTODRAFT_264911 [Cylindrobasidium torrendii FP15055 ss-10]|uniref:Uncharacterized protein n=1 Tax=Cylindrobasidium torrendii FP15055 ss-10 TaxID=1314674 RepID=A0A0D7BCP0_9AGAR|nr:hypothetical protein CYLTODRAFT_264911 [Cylindrobasidium torrendii FP15055 ss-10]
MQRSFDSFLRRWHKMLGLSLQSPPSWYRDRLREELRERRTATTFIERLSETSDVYFCVVRARYDGFPQRKLPPCPPMVYAYMLAKYSLRWGFYRTTAILCRAPHYASLSEVVNPAKDSKLDEVSARNQIESEKFRIMGRRLRKVWPLLP